MKVYQVVRKSASLFKSMTGLKKAEFDRLTKQFTLYLTFSKIGRPHSLKEIEFALFFILFYYRHYCTQQLMSLIFRIDQSQISRWIDLLQLPFSRCTGKYIDIARKRISSIEELLEYNPDLDVIIDCTERPILTHHNSKELFSGKKNFCTVKNLVAVNRKTKEITYSSKTRKGARHDFYRFKEFKEDIPPWWNLLLDLGFVGARDEVPNRCFLPYKALPKQGLSDYEIQQNKVLSKQRCRGEHPFGQMKQFKILSDEFRGSSKLCDLSFQAIVGVYNFRRQSRKRF